MLYLTFNPLGDNDDLIAVVCNGNVLAMSNDVASLVRFYGPMAFIG